MTGRRYPWRVVVFATIAVFGNFYLAYYLLFELASDGVDVRDGSGQALVTQVWPDSPAARSGMKTGDLLVEVNGQRIGNVVDWLRTEARFLARFQMSDLKPPLAIRWQRKATSTEAKSCPR